MKLSKAKKETLGSLALVIIPIIALFASAIFINRSQKDTGPTVAIETKDNIDIPVVVAKVSQDPAIQAKAAYAKDLNTGKILFAKNETASLPLASLTKLMTALVAKRNGSDNQLVRVSDADLATDGESLIYSQEVFTLKDLIDITLVGSVNDTASAISGILNNNKSTFIEEMNRTASQIGLTNSSFTNETGLDTANESMASANGSAKDITNLVEYILKNHPDILDSTTQKSVTVNSLDGVSHTVKNTNEIINKLPGLLGSKTGYTDVAGGNLAVVVDKGLNEPVVIVVLGSPNTETRFADVLEILESIKE